MLQAGFEHSGESHPKMGSPEVWGFRIARGRANTFEIPKRTGNQGGKTGLGAGAA